MVQREERAEQAAAFEVYYLMSGDRSLVKLHQYLSDSAPDSKKVPCLKTLKNWSSWFHWQKRILIKDKAVAAGIEKKTTKAIIDRKAQYLELVDALIDSCFERDKDGKLRFKLQIEKPRDLKEAVELALKLMGEPERSELAVSFEWLEKKEERKKEDG